MLSPPDIEAVISTRHPDMLQPLTSGTFMTGTIHRRGDTPAAFVGRKPL